MTKIAVSSTGKNLDSVIDPRFGRCDCFLIIDTDTMDFKPLTNPAADAAGGAGIQAAQVVTAEGVSTVITGSVGPHAMSSLNSAGVEILSGVTGTVRQAVDAFKRGDLKPVTAAGPAYAGMDAGYGAGQGRRGYGRGRRGGQS